jgi:hypothetical protein
MIVAELLRVISRFLTECYSDKRFQGSFNALNTGLIEEKDLSLHKKRLKMETIEQVEYPQLCERKLQNLFR